MRSPDDRDLIAVLARVGVERDHLRLFRLDYVYEFSPGLLEVVELASLSR